MRVDSLEILRAADPAKDVPESSRDERERLIRAIVATPLDEQAARPRPRRRRRFVLIAVTGGAVLVLGATAYATSYVLGSIDKGPNPPMTAEEWRAEYYSWTQGIELPPGAQWRGFRDPGNAVTSAGAGRLQAVFEAMGHWSREWLAAAAEGDAARAAVADAWVSRLLATVPVITDADTERALDSEWGTESMTGMDENGARYWQDAVAAARRGDFRRLVRLAIGFTHWDEPAESGTATSSITGGTEPTRAHEVVWSVTGDVWPPNAGPEGSAVEITRDEALAEGRDVYKAIGSPPGAGLGDRLLDGLPAGIDPHEYPFAATDWKQDTFYLGDGFKDAFEKLWFAWWGEWVAAVETGDGERSAAAADATRRLGDLLPRSLSHDGDLVTLRLDDESAQDLRQLAARAQNGDPSGVAEWLAGRRAYWEVRLDWAGYGEIRLVCGGRTYPVEWRTETVAEAATPAAAPGTRVSATEARTEYAIATSRFTLPAGIRWPEWPSGDGMVRVGDGVEHAAGYAWLAWWREWVRADEAGDQNRVAAATAASARLHDLLAKGVPAGPGMSVLLDAAALRDFARLDAGARQGDIQGLRYWLVYQLVYRTEIGRLDT